MRAADKAWQIVAAVRAEERRRQRTSAGPATPAPRLQKVRPGQRTQISPLFIAIAAGAVIIPICRKFGWIDKLLEKLPFGPKGTGKKKGGGLSRFRFPGQKQQDAGSSSGGPAQKGAKQPVAQASSSLPRNKQANNKKNKERKKDKRDERDKKRDDIANGAASGTAGGPGTLPMTDGKGNKIIALNNVPKDDEILGGADGKTFTTHSRFKTSEMYARIRDERGGA